MLFVMVAVFAGSFGVVTVLLLVVHRQMRSRNQGQTSDADSSPDLLRDESVSTISLWARLLETADFTEILKRHMAQADIGWSAGRFTLLMLLTGAMGCAGAMRFMPLGVAVLAGGAASAAPYMWLLWRRKRRFFRFEQSFPDALDSLARSLRSGHPLSVGLEMLAYEAEEPVQSELRRTAMEAHFGMPWEQALVNLGRRVPILEVSTFIAACQLHTRTGGKLSEMLARMAENMRETSALKGEVKAIAAQGRMTGLILTILPIGITLMMLWVDPPYILLLVHHPYGKYLIGAAVGCLAAAHLAIRRIVDINP